MPSDQYRVRVLTDGDKTLVDFSPPAGVRPYLTHHDGYGLMREDLELLDRIRAARKAREESGYAEAPPMVTGFSREAMLPPWRRNLKRLWNRFVQNALEWSEG